MELKEIRKLNYLSEKQMNIDRRRSKDKMLKELEEVLSQRAMFWTERKKNQWAQYENTHAAGRAEAYIAARVLLTEILKKGK
jgi:hypothetical protein